jgi:ComF family protein
MGKILLTHGSGGIAAFRSAAVKSYSAVRQAASELAETVFPSQCEICGDTADGYRRFAAICPACLKSMAAPQHVCVRCGAPVPTSTTLGDDCSHCQRHKWSFKRATCLGPYDDQLRKAVILAKSRFHDGLALRLGELLADHIQSLQLQAPEVVIPTPQHWLRRVVHRSNSSELIAEVLSNRLGIACHRTWLRRIRQTQKQGLLSTEQRRKNVAGAFAVSKWSRFSGKRVLLVDDILTSGSTAHEMAKVIKKAGATFVEVAAVARGVGTNPAGKA